MGAARYRDVYIAGPDLVAPVLRGAAPPVDGAPYRISPFFPACGCDIFDVVVGRAESLAVGVPMLALLLLLLLALPEGMLRRHTD